MRELNQYRVQLIEKLAATANDLRAACLAAKDPFTPLEEGGWNVHQIAAHARDVNKMVYGLRVRRTAEEDNPEFQNFDGDAYAREHYAADEALQSISDEFVQSVEALAELLKSLPVEAWSRMSRHEKLGSELTLQLWVERGLAHIEEHLGTARKEK